jgi:hypothetical protein
MCAFKLNLLYRYHLGARAGLASWKVPGVQKPSAGELMDSLTSFNAVGGLHKLNSASS